MKRIISISKPIYMVFFAALLGAGIFTGCKEDSSLETGLLAMHKLTQVADADGYKETIRQSLRHQALTNLAADKENLQWCDGESIGRGGDDVMVADVEDSIGAPGAPQDAVANDDGAESGKSSEGPDYTETNVQEQGVDEADIVKTDGTNLYVLSTSHLNISKVNTDGTLDTQSTLKIETYPMDMFIYGDMAVIVSNVWSDTQKYNDKDMPWDALDEEIPDVDIWYGGMEQARVTFVDISDKTNPQITRETTYEGRYISSRRIDNALRVVLSSDHISVDLNLNIDWYDLCEYPKNTRESLLEAEYKKVLKKIDAAVAKLDVSEIMPQMTDKIGEAAANTYNMVEYANLYAPETPLGLGLTTIASFDLDEPQSRGTNVAIFARPGIVYASQTALYVTSDRDYVRWAFGSGLWSEETTGIHKFDIQSNPKKVNYKATGTITGRMLNQFSMGEKDNYLRVAATSGGWDWTEWDNHIYILGEESGKLEVVGHIDGIGAEEEVYAARFLGDRGFVVTFRQMDPLYTFDLSDPTDPKVVGEWEGPGYSTYLHPFGDNHLIAVGWEDNVTLSLYDLTKFAEPKLVERIPLVAPEKITGYDWYYVWSVAMHDHKAFTFRPNNGTLALPYVYSGDTYDETTQEYSYSYRRGIALYDVTTEGITPTSEMVFPEDANYEPVRSIFIDNYLLGISKERVRTSTLDDTETLIDELTLEDEGLYYGGGYGMPEMGI